MTDQVSKLLNDARDARRAGQLEDARRSLTEAIDLCRRGNEQRKLAAALETLGQIERDLQHPDLALSHYEEAAVIYRAEDYELGLAHAIRHIADIQRERGNTEQAESFYDHALWLYRDIKETTPLELANAIRGLAILKSESGDLERARQLWIEARDLYSTAGVQPGVDESSRRLAAIESKR